MSWEGAVVGVKVLEDEDRRWHFLQFAAKLWLNHFPGQLSVQRLTKKIWSFQSSLVQLGLNH